MNEPQNKAKPMTLSHWLISCLMTGALVCGAVGALAVFFLADGFFSVGADPAVPVEKVQAEVEKVDARVTALEKQAAQVPEAAVTTETTATEAPAAPATTTPAAPVVDDHANKASQIILSITQIKDAYENDKPMGPGIDLLKSSVTNTDVKRLLDDLGSLVADKFPTRASLVAQAQNAVGMGPKPYDLSGGSAGTSWQQKLQNFVGDFISIRPTASITQESQGNSLVQALSSDNLPLANSIISKMPTSPALQSLALQIQTRLKAQATIHELITTVTQMMGKGSAGALY